MATIKAGDHPFEDAQLITAAELSRLLGVSQPRVSQVVAEQSGRLDQFVNSRGSLRYHPEISVRQWHERKVVAKVSTPTQAQAAAGVSNLGAQARAHIRPGTPSTTPQASSHTEEALRGDEHELALSRAKKERQQARLLEIKVGKEERDLVPVAEIYLAARGLATSIKDHIFGIPPQVAPRISSAIEEALISSGVAPEQARAIVGSAKVEHVAHEAMRSAFVRSLRTLSELRVEDLVKVPT